MQPRLLQLRRLVIGETGRFPELGQLFYERGPGRTMSALATVFERLSQRGVLVLDDPLLAAAHFNWLVMSIPLNRAMLLGDDSPLADAELDRCADSGVSVFLAAYGSAPRLAETADPPAASAQKPGCVQVSEDRSPLTPSNRGAGTFQHQGYLSRPAARQRLLQRRESRQSRFPPRAGRYGPRDERIGWNRDPVAQVAIAAVVDADRRLVGLLPNIQGDRNVPADWDRK